jgi:hypothetical protein
VNVGCCCLCLACKGSQWERGKNRVIQISGSQTFFFGVNKEMGKSTLSIIHGSTLIIKCGDRGRACLVPLQMKMYVSPIKTDLRFS